AMGNDLSHRLAVDAHKQGHRNTPGAPWPDERPPRPYQPPKQPPRPPEPEEPLDRSGPQARRDDRQDYGRLSAVLTRLNDTISQAERSPAPISCPPPFRGGGIRMA